MAEVGAADFSDDHVSPASSEGQLLTAEAMGQNHGTLVNTKIDGKRMFIHPNMVL